MSRKYYYSHDCTCDQCAALRNRGLLSRLWAWLNREPEAWGTAFMAILISLIILAAAKALLS